MSQSNQDKPEPRMTVKQLHELVRQLFDDTQAQLHNVDNDLATAEHQLKADGYAIEELNRKSRGITTIHAKFSILEKRLALLESQMNSDNPVLLKQFEKSGAAGFEKIEAQLSELHGDLTGQMGILQETVDQLTETVSVHTETLSDHGIKIEMLNEGTSSLNTRVIKIEEKESKFPVVGFVVALVAGLIVGLSWYSHTFVQNVSLPDGSTFVLAYEPANSVWAAVLAGLAAFGIVMGIASFFARKTKTTETHDVEAHSHDVAKPSFFSEVKRGFIGARERSSRAIAPKQTPAIPAVPTPPTQERAADAPTEVIPTSAGAVGARP